jgi:ABC-type molybdate transport system substrate-binding protein
MEAHKSILSLVLALCFVAIPTRAQEIAVAAADLKFAMSEVAGQYEKQTGNKGERYVRIERKFLFPATEWGAV